MKKQIGMFIGCQIFFILLFSALAIQVSNYEGLQPFDSNNETVNINLNAFETIKEIQGIARANQMNIAYYNPEKQIYYLDFSLEDNPQTIYGMSTRNFVYKNFKDNDCASTILKKKCQIRLSSPNKMEAITLHSFDNLDPNMEINNIILYPSSFKTKDDNINPFLSKYPNATFLAHRNLDDNVFFVLIIIFLFCNTLILLSMLQNVHRAGKQIGVAKLFGQPFIHRCLIPLGKIIVILSLLSTISYYLLHTFLTFDWTYLKYVAFYYFVTMILFAISLSISYFSVNFQHINLLVKGRQQSKFLMQMFLFICCLSLIFSGYLISFLSENIRLLSDGYRSFSYYQNTLERAGTIPLKESSIPLLLQHEPTFIAKNTKLFEYFEEDLEYKNQTNIIYSGTDNIFPAFYINKNLALKYFKSAIQTMHLKNPDTVYVFTSDITNQQSEIETLKTNFTKQKNKKKVVIIEHENTQLKEFIQNQTDLQHSSLNYIELQHPIYIYDNANDTYLDAMFTTEYGHGFYIALDTEEAQQKWNSASQKLSELGLLDYYNEPATLSEFHKKTIQDFWFMVTVTLFILFLSMIGMIVLIQTCLQEYFRINRKRLVLEKVFGQSFINRYSFIFASVFSIFSSSWLWNTFTKNEWFLTNISFFVFLLSMLYLIVQQMIRRLEHESINIILKE